MAGSQRQKKESANIQQGGYLAGATACQGQARTSHHLAPWYWDKKIEPILLPKLLAELQKLT